MAPLKILEISRWSKIYSTGNRFSLPLLAWIGQHVGWVANKFNRNWCYITVIQQQKRVLINLVQYRLGAIELVQSSWCTSSWCIELVHINLVQYRLGAHWLGAYRVGAKEHIFCMNSEIFLENVLHFFTKILYDKWSTIL